MINVRLRTLGGTEDADLGIRAAALGRTVGVINSATYEEANCAPGNWVRQRSRWIKGSMQTLLVHLRRPETLVRTAGVRQTAAFALLVGGTPMTFLCTPSRTPPAAPHRPWPAEAPPVGAAAGAPAAVRGGLDVAADQPGLRRLVGGRHLSGISPTSWRWSPRTGPSRSTCAAC